MSKLPPRADIARLVSRGIKISTIANMFHVSYMAVYNRLNEPWTQTKSLGSRRIVHRETHGSSTGAIPCGRPIPLREREIRDFYPEWGVKQGYVE